MYEMKGLRTELGLVGLFFLFLHFCNRNFPDTLPICTEYQIKAAVSDFWSQTLLLFLTQLH